MEATVVDYSRETKIEIFLRRNAWILYLVTLITISALYAGVAGCLLLFNKGYYWSVVPAGLLAHGFFVITIHDAAHQGITRTRFDYIIMNVCSGLLTLPLFAELFRKYHLIHHDHTNTEHDPLWSPAKNKMFEKRRWLYAFLQCVPFAFNVAILIKSQKDKNLDGIQQGKVNPWGAALSFVVAGLVICFVQPSVWFVLGGFTVLTTLGAIRHWSEHMGVEEGKESNTHWFPFGMGVGNHDIHHYEPQYSWLTNSIGLMYRPKDTNPFRTLHGIFFDKRFTHYRTQHKKSS